MKKILVVDDSPIVLRSIREILKDKYTVVLSPQGSKAIELAVRYEVDLILLDYEMPDVNGLEVFKQIKKDVLTSHIPVIFLTGMTDKTKIVEVLSYQPAGYILKPFYGDKVIETVSKVLGPEEDELIPPPRRYY